MPTHGIRILVLLTITLCLAIPSFAREWKISRFISNVTVAQDGTISVREHLVVDFEGDYHGIYRDIPIEYPGPHGTNYELFLKIVGVHDAMGHRLKYDSNVRNGNRHLKIYIPDASNSTQSIEIDYTVINGIRWFDGYDELYWNVTGNDWPVPIDRRWRSFSSLRTRLEICAPRPLPVSTVRQRRTLRSSLTAMSSKFRLTIRSPCAKA